MRLKTAKHGPPGGFDVLNVPDADQPDIFNPLCKYLANDYDMLRKIYDPYTGPKECNYTYE